MSGKITGYDPKTQNFIDTDLFDVSKHVTQTSGVLEIGVSYTILDFNAGDNFTNVATVISGTINTTGCVFMATGTTPTTYSNGSTLAHYVTQSYDWSNLVTEIKKGVTSGINNVIPKYSSIDDEYVDSIITDNGTVVTIGGNLTVTGYVDTANHFLKAAGFNTVDWATCLLSSTDGFSVNWGNRSLVKADGTAQLKWDFDIVKVHTTNSFLDFSSFSGEELRIGSDPTGTVNKSVTIKAYNGANWKTGFKYKNTTASVDPILSMPDIQVGNSGLSSGDCYYDTAANALANSDLILIRKV